MSELLNYIIVISIYFSTGTKLTAPVCVAPVIPKNLSVILQASGCVNVGQKSINGGENVEACYSKNGIDTNGYVSQLYSVGNFTISSSNTTCSGIKQPFLLTGDNGAPLATSSNFLGVLWNVNCMTGAMSLPDSSLVFCSRFNGVSNSFSSCLRQHEC